MKEFVSGCWIPCMWEKWGFGRKFSGM